MFLLTLTLNMGVWFEITFMLWHRCDPASLMHLRGCICNLVQRSLGDSKIPGAVIDW